MLYIYTYVFKIILKHLNRRIVLESHIIAQSARHPLPIPRLNAGEQVKALDQHFRRGFVEEDMATYDLRCMTYIDL